MNIEGSHLALVVVSVGLATLMVILTAIIIAGQRAIRQAIARARRSRSPEYWRMYARVCEAHATDLVPDIDELR